MLFGLLVAVGVFGFTLFGLLFDCLLVLFDAWLVVLIDCLRLREFLGLGVRLDCLVCLLLFWVCFLVFGWLFT